jgi:hypothetical protein
MAMFMGPHRVPTRIHSAHSFIVSNMHDQITADDHRSLDYMIQQINFRMTVFDERVTVTQVGDIVRGQGQTADLSVAPTQFHRLFFNLSQSPLQWGTTRVPPGGAYVVQAGVATTAVVRTTARRMRILIFLLNPIH